MKHKTIHRALALLLAFALAAGLLSGLSFPAQAAGSRKSRTIMLYIVGTDLESVYGLATNNLKQILSVPYNDDINIVAYTGGCQRWYMPREYLSGAAGIDTKRNQVWRLEGRQKNQAHGRMTLCTSSEMTAYESASLCDPEPLTAFLDFCCTSYPAEKYDLIFWDHGMGPHVGFGYDPRDNIMNPDELVSALNASSIIRSGEKFDIIDFDACLMGSVEIAALLSPYAQILVGSAELEPGYGQEYSGWVSTLLEDPAMDGFELGKAIVDSTMNYYLEEQPEEWGVTLSAVQLDNFRSRMLDDLTAVDELLIREAKTVGSNSRYNFYDELYALENCVEYSYGDSSLYDLGNLLGALSVPQSESDLLTEEQVAALENGYTPYVLRLLAALADSDGSDDDVIYTRAMEDLSRRVSLGCARDLTGTVVWPDDTGTFRVDPSGLSIAFGDRNYVNGAYFDLHIPEAADLMPDGPAKTYLKMRSAAVAYYGLITASGKCFSALAADGSEELEPSDLDTYLEKTKYYNTFAVLVDHLASSGEMENQDAAWNYVRAVSQQQIDEVVTKEKVSAKQILNSDGTASAYQVTVTGSSAQAFMSIDAAYYVRSQCEDTAEVAEYLARHFYSFFQTYFPNGICLPLAQCEGELKIADYYDDLSDTDTQIYRRIYASPESTWIVPKPNEPVFVLYDGEGNMYLADPIFVDKSGNVANLPFMLCRPDEDSTSLRYTNMSMLLIRKDGVWKIMGITQDNAEYAGRYLPMNDPSFEGCLFASRSSLTSPLNDSDYTMPISEFFAIDREAANWGISFGYVSTEALEGAAQYDSRYYVEDIYHSKIDVTERFRLADEAAQEGDTAYALDGARLEIENPVYDGTEQRPAVNVILDGRELVPGTDFKVIYDGSSEPGYAYLAVMGIGDYVGTVYGRYTILCTEHDFGEWEETKASTWDEDGEESRVCHVCGFAETRAIPNKTSTLADGDMDCDGAVTSDDALYLLRHTFKPDQYPIRISGDFDEDGAVTSDDAIYLLRHVLNPAAYPLAAVPAPAEAEVWAEFAAVLRRYSQIHR